MSNFKENVNKTIAVLPQMQMTITLNKFNLVHAVIHQIEFF